MLGPALIVGMEVVSVTDGSFDDQRGRAFDRVDLTGACFRDVDLTRGWFQRVALHDVVMRGVELVDVQIDGEVEKLIINGVDVAPLVEAELDRRYPDRVKMRPVDAAGFREAWDLLEELWDATVARARRLDPVRLHERVDGEWSFIETLRHLVFATDAWIRRVIMGDPRPWDPLDLPFDGMPDLEGIPRDREARPSLGQVLALRRDRRDSVRRLLADMTDPELDEQTEPVPGAGWPVSDSYPVRDCLLIVLNEEWQHRLYAERDLDALSATGS